MEKPQAIKKMSFPFPVTDVAFEAQCIVTLAGMKNQRVIRDTKKKKYDKGAQLQIVRFPAPEFFCGKATGLFIGSFVSRTSKSFESIVDLNLIQKTINWLSFCLPNEKGNTTGKKVFDPACQAYFLAAVAMGVLQTGHFKKGIVNSLYKKMHSTLKPCYEDERHENILAHLLIAHFCRLTAQTHEYRKHSGYARVLLKYSESVISTKTRTASMGVIFSEQLHSLACVIDIEIIKVVHVQLCSKLSRAQFYHKFSCLVDFVRASSNKMKSDLLDSELKEAIQQVSQASNMGLMAYICVLTARFVQEYVGNLDISTTTTLKALAELRELYEFAIQHLQLASGQLSPFIRVHIQFVEVFQLIYEKDLLKAKQLLDRSVSAMDTFMLCHFMTLYPLMEHHLHFILGALALLSLDDAYKSLQKKMNCVFIATQSVKMWPASLRELCSQNCLPSFVCTSAKCQMNWVKLHLTNEKEDEGIILFNI